MGETSKGDATVPSELVTKSVKSKTTCFKIWACIGACVLLVAAAALLNVLSYPVSIGIWTVIIVFCLRGVVNKFSSKGMSRPLATALAYILMFVVLGALAFLMLSPAFGFGAQFQNLFESMPTYVAGIIAWTEEVYNEFSGILANDMVRNAIDAMSAAITAWASDVASQSASLVMSFGTTLVNSFVALGFAFVVAFWLLMDLPTIGREISNLVSEKRKEDAQMLHITLTRVMGGYIKGTLLQCFIIGVGCGILFWAVGIPNALALGVITGVMNILPIIGPWIGGGLAALVGLLTSPVAAVIALVGTICIQQFVYTFISPRIMADSVDVYPAVTLIVLMIGSAIGSLMSGLVGSLVGMLVAIPAVAVMKSVFVYYFEKKTKRVIISEDGVLFKGKPAKNGEANPLADATAQPLSSLEDSEEQHDEAETPDVKKEA